MTLLQLQAGGGGMASVADQPIGAIAKRLVQVKTGHGSAGSLAKLLAKGHDDRWAVVEVDQPTGNNPDNSGMPPFLTKHDRTAFLQPSLRCNHLLSFLDDFTFNLLPPHVHQIKFLGDRSGHVEIVGGEHLDGLHRALKASGGVDPRSQVETDHPGGELRLPEAARDPHQRPETGRRDGMDARQAVPDEHAVFAFERDDVGDRGHRDQAERSTR